MAIGCTVYNCKQNKVEADQQSKRFVLWRDSRFRLKQKAFALTKQCFRTMAIFDNDYLRVIKCFYFSNYSRL